MMNHFEILHQRYAKALFDFGKETNSLDKIMQDLDVLNNITHLNRQFFQVLIHPEISKDEKLKILNNISEKCEFCSGSMDFLNVLVGKNRLNLIHGIFLRYRDYYDKERKKAKVFVRSAVKLNEAQIDKLLKQLCRCFKEEAILNIETDPSLIGGLFVKIHDRIYDASVAGMLHNISKRLAE